MAGEAQTPTQSDQEIFDGAWSEALKEDEPKPAVPPGTAQDPPGGEKPPAAATPVPAPARIPSPAPEPAPAGEEAAAAAVETATAGAGDQPPVQPAAPAPEGVDAELARLRAENAAFRAAQAAPAPAPAPAPAQAAPVEPAPAPAAPAPPIGEPKWYQLSDDDQARMAAFQKDWPDIFEATQVVTKQAAYNVAEYVFNQVARAYNPALEYFEQIARTMQDDMALTSLRAMHPDYDQIYDKVVAWADTLPGPFKRGAKDTIESGTLDDVNQLISAYKNSVGVPVPAGGTGAVATAGAPVRVPQTTGLSAAANKAAGKLQVVGSKRTTPTPQVDPNDFDGAWEEALRQP